ncbi:hypothetical protein [Leptospira kemamanensis]|uniref:hypothetical protein n=1 Tax=Leptospira kemamanensis TaxID=2484942 RepID=UPI001ABF4CA0|nr:hypothetical protein [Leptospira kemamanensis]
MKRYPLVILFLISFFTNCMIGTQKQACMYYLDRDFKSYCDQLVLLSPKILSAEKDFAQASVSNIVLVGCLTYLKKKKDCKKEENKYLPGLYGANDFFDQLNHFQLFQWKKQNRIS